MFCAALGLGPLGLRFRLCRFGSFLCGFGYYVRLLSWGECNLYFRVDYLARI